MNQAPFTPHMGKLRLQRILHRWAQCHGIRLDSALELRGGHWYGCRDGHWIRTTDLLKMEVWSCRT